MPVGQPISQSVFRQIKARQDNLSKKNRSPEDIAALTSNSVFIRLSSSVNTLTESEAENILLTGNANNTGDPSAAQSKVLYSLGFTDDTNYGKNAFTFNPQVGNPGFGMQIDESLGIRPVTGITGFSVKSKNTYGTLREGTIDVRINTKEDLERFEKLYFRPGYTFLLEWGHTVYFLSEQGTYNSEVLSISDFFKGGQEIKDVEAKIDKLRKKSDYNYDGMVGYCKNFTWSLNPDGSYTGQVSLISSGAVIESLKTNLDASVKFPFKKYFEADDKDEGKKQRKSPLHFVLAELEKQSSEQVVKRSLAVESVEHLDRYLPNEEILGVRADQDLADTGMIFEDTINLQWFTLRTLCELVNRLLVPNTSADKNRKPLIRFNVLYDEERMKIALDNGGDPTKVVRTDYTTHPNHFSIDPYVCFLPTAPVDEVIQDAAVVDINDSSMFKMLGSAVLAVATLGVSVIYAATQAMKPGIQKLAIENINKVKSERFKNRGIQELNTINTSLDILVSNYYLYDILDAIYDQKEGDKSLIAIFTKILDGINDALGNITQLDLYFSEPDNTYYIVDRKVQMTLNPPPSISISGLNTTVTKLDISSKISNEMASMISIAAQGTKEATSDSLGAMFKMNSGMIDRFLPKKKMKEDDEESGTEEEKLNQDAEKLEKWLEDLDDTFSSFCGRFGTFNKKYKKADHEALKSYHKMWNQQQLETDKESKGEPPVGVIPLELSLTMDGISGLLVAESFNVDTVVLPDSYKKYSYIITGLEHSIVNNRWYTDIKTQFYISQKPPQSVINAAKASVAAQTKTREAIIDNNTHEGVDNINFANEVLPGDSVDYSLLKKAVNAKGYKWFTEPFKLNIVGIRNMQGSKVTNYGRSLPGTNHFDDLICVAYTDGSGNEVAESFPASTDPGFANLIKPSNPAGTAILKEGAYYDCWSIGKHGGSERTRHVALKQTGGKVTVYRDKNRDKVYNLDDRQTQTGYFGINIHKGSVGTKTSTNVGAWSAGCQVFKNGAQQQKVMQLCKQQIDKVAHNKFSYILLNTQDKVIKDSPLGKLG